MATLTNKQENDLNAMFERWIRSMGFIPDALLPVGLGTLLNQAIDATGNFAAAPQALSGAGAITLTSKYTSWTSEGTGDALTLADGTFVGQEKHVRYAAEGAGADTGVITPDTPSGFATVTLNGIGDQVTFVWTGAAWVIGATVGSPTIA